MLRSRASLNNGYFQGNCTLSTSGCHHPLVRCTLSTDCTVTARSCSPLRALPDRQGKLPLAEEVSWLQIPAVFPRENNLFPT